MVSSLDEESLEALIVKQMTTPAADGGGWEQGSPADYDRAHAVDLVQLTAFLRTTQPGLVAPLGLEEDSVVRRKFLARLQGEIAKHGIVHVLRNGLQHRVRRATPAHHVAPPC